MSYKNTEHYVTFFDSTYLPQGLALHSSMERHLRDYCLWVICADADAYEILQKLGLKNIRLLKLLALETDQLKQAKTNRNKKEYIWTLSPFAPRFVFEADPSVERVTYIDADMWFLKCPKAIFQEFERSGKAVMITDHAYAPEFDSSSVSGQFCVQFMIFTRNGEVVRKWWEDRCIEWCHEYYEDGKLGDQRYLDDWPDRFADMVHVLENKELMLAPWNATRFPYGNGVVWHFHGLRISARGSSLKVQCTNYPLPLPTYRNVYIPYVENLKLVRGRLKQVGFEVISQAKFRHVNPIKKILRGLYHMRWMSKVDFDFEI